MKVFIGHSFADMDEPLVNSIISFLAKKGLRCETGEKAQNKSVSGKVKLRIDNCEIFLGIFTVDQQIKQLEEASVSPSFINKFIPSNKSTVNKTPPLFTTSNWVLQESGYAIGKGKKIIFMVENGVYKFPELQGDDEIIPFDRLFLDKPFLKLIEMLMGDTFFAGAGVQAGSAPTESQVELNAEEKKAKPAFMEMFDAHEEKDMKKVEKIYQENVRPSLEPKERKLWDAVLLRWQYTSGEANKFAELEKMYNETKEYEVGIQLGICYEEFDKYQDARGIYLKCLQDDSNNAHKFNCHLRVAKCYIGEKDYDKAAEVLLDIINNPIYFQHVGEAISVLVQVAEEKKDDYLYFVFAEKALDINPVNTALRFNLAYKYSNNDKEDLALYHYKKLLETSENVTALNNIGVAYSNLEMPSKGVAFYEKASLKKNTLANSNLAYKYLNEGFVEAAEKLLRSSDELSKEGIEVHENIGYAKKALKEKVEAEDKKEAEVLSKATTLHNFRIKHSEAFCKPLTTGIDLSGKWVLGEWGEIDIKWDRAKGVFIGSSSVDFSVPSSGGLGLSGFINPTMITKTRIVELLGSVHNSAGRFTLKVREPIKGTVPSLLSSGLDEVYNSTGLFIVNTDGIAIDAMEEVKNKERLYRQYKKVGTS